MILHMPDADGPDFEAVVSTETNELLYDDGINVLYSGEHGTVVPKGNGRSLLEKHIAQGGIEYGAKVIPIVIVANLGS